MQTKGLTSKFLLNIFENTIIDLRIKREFLKLYEAMYLDCNPFCSISNFENKCIRFKLKNSQLM